MVISRGCRLKEVCNTCADLFTQVTHHTRHVNVVTQHTWLMSCQPTHKTFYIQRISLLPHNTPCCCHANLHTKHFTYNAFHCCHTTHLADVMPTYTQNILHTTHFSVHTTPLQMSCQPTHNSTYTLYTRHVKVATQHTWPHTTHFTCQTHQCSHTTHNQSTYNNSLYMPDSLM